MSNVDHYFEVLGLPPNASPQETEEAYKNLMRVWSPDRFQDDKALQDKAVGKLRGIEIAYHALMATILSEGQHKQQGQTQATLNTNNNQDTNKFTIWLAGRAEEIVADKEYQDDASELMEQQITSHPWMWSQEQYNTESESIISKTENALEPILPETKEKQVSEAYLKQKQEWQDLKAKLEIEAQQKVAKSKEVQTQKASFMGEQASQSSPASEMGRAVLQELQYAGFWLRLLAYLIDSVLVGIIYYFFSIISGGGTNAKILWVVPVWLYFAFMESSSKQATLGKMIVGIIVTDLDRHKITFGKATGRFFGKFISGILLCAGFIMVAFTTKKQGLHDIMAGCLVVNSDAKVSDHVSGTSS